MNLRLLALIAALTAPIEEQPRRPRRQKVKDPRFPTVLHTLPACNTFMETSVTDFLRLNRERREN